MEYDDFFTENAIDEEKRYIILIIYDIVDNKRRSHMVKYLEGYGVRVQKSAFEAYINRASYERLMKSAAKIIDLDTDSLRIYFLNSSTAVRSWGIGDKHVEDVIII